MASAHRDRRGVSWFVAWVLIGSAWALGILSLLSIGFLVLIVAALVTAILVRRPEARVGLAGLVSGLSLPLFYVAYLNRSGPGTICTSTATSQTCTVESSPWPWIVIGIVLLAAGVFWFAAAGRRRAVANPAR